jgi:hypothetical protein
MGAVVGDEGRDDDGTLQHRLRNIAEGAKAAREALRFISGEASRAAGRRKGVLHVADAGSSCAGAGGISPRSCSSTSSICSDCDAECWFGCKCDCHASYTALEARSPLRRQKEGTCASPTSSCASTVSSSSSASPEGPQLEEEVVFTTHQAWMHEDTDPACRSCLKKCWFGCSCICHRRGFMGPVSSSSASSVDGNDGSYEEAPRPGIILPVDAATSNYSKPKGIRFGTSVRPPIATESRTPGPRYYKVEKAERAIYGRVRGGYIRREGATKEAFQDIKEPDELRLPTDIDFHVLSTALRPPAAVITPLPKTKPRIRRYRRPRTELRDDSRAAPPRAARSPVSASFATPSLIAPGFEHRRRTKAKLAAEPGPGAYETDVRTVSVARGGGTSSLATYSLGGLIQPPRTSKSRRASEEEMLKGLNAEQRAKVLDIIEDVKREEEEAWRKEMGFESIKMRPRKLRQQQEQNRSSSKEQAPAKKLSETPSSSKASWIVRLRRVQKKMEHATGPGAYDIAKAEAARDPKVKGGGLYAQSVAEQLLAKARVGEAKARARRDGERRDQPLGVHEVPQRLRARKPTFRYHDEVPLRSAAKEKKAREEQEAAGRPVGLPPSDWATEVKGPAALADLQGREEVNVLRKGVTVVRSFASAPERSKDHLGPGAYDVAKLTRTGKIKEPSAPRFEDQVSRADIVGPGGERPESAMIGGEYEQALLLEPDLEVIRRRPKAFKFSEVDRWADEIDGGDDAREAMHGALVYDPEPARLAIGPRTPFFAVLDRMPERGSERKVEEDGDVLQLSVDLDFGKPRRDKGAAAFSGVPRFAASAREQEEGDILQLSVDADYGKRRAQQGVRFERQLGRSVQEDISYYGGEEVTEATRRELAVAAIEEEVRRSEAIDRILVPPARQAANLNRDRDASSGMDAPISEWRQADYNVNIDVLSTKKPGAGRGGVRNFDSMPDRFPVAAGRQDAVYFCDVEGENLILEPATAKDMLRKNVKGAAAWGGGRGKAKRTSTTST